MTNMKVFIFEFHSFKLIYIFRRKSNKRLAIDISRNVNKKAQDLFSRAFNNEY